MSNSFNIINGETYTLSDVRAFQVSGGSVLRSAHIGNFDTVTLFLAQEGFPIILHEHIRGNSKIYEPAYIKLDSRMLPLVEDVNLPLTHLIITDNRIKGIEKAREIIKDVKNPAYFHYFSLRMLCPENISLVSDSFLKQEKFFKKVLIILSKKFSHLFTHYIREDGSTFILQKEQKYADKRHIYESAIGEKIIIRQNQIAKLALAYLRDTIKVSLGKNIKPQGIVMPVIFYVLFSAICEIYKSRNGEQRYKRDGVVVMHFSGAAMTDYLILKKEEALYNSQKIEEMYQVLLGEMPDILPKKIDFVLVPTRFFKNFIATSEKQLNSMEKLFKSYEKFMETIKGLNKNQSVECFKKNKYAMCRDAWSINMPQEVSQYDILLRGNKLYAPNFLFYKSPKYLRKMRNFLIKECVDNNP